MKRKKELKRAKEYNNHNNDDKAEYACTLGNSQHLWRSLKCVLFVSNGIVKSLNAYVDDVILYAVKSFDTRPIRRNCWWTVAQISSTLNLLNLLHLSVFLSNQISIRWILSLKIDVDSDFLQ